MISIHYKITGRVQGVAYRAFARDKARQLGIVGWVKNHHDGSVQCLATADQLSLEMFETELKQGPRWAKVSRVEKEVLTETTELNDFKVRF